MEHKKAAEILIKMLEKHPFSAEEKQAVLAAVGVLSWTALAQSRIRGLRAKRDKKAKGK
jgi:hypothetical protein